MTSRLLTSTVFALAAILGSVCALSLAADPLQLRDRFLQEAPDGWRNLSAILLHSRGRVHLSSMTKESSGDVSNAYQEDIVFMLSGDDRRRVEATDKDTRKVSVGCRNRLRAFWLNGIPGTRDEYRIDRLYDASDQHWTDGRIAEDHMWRVAPLVYTPFAIDDHDLTDIVSSSKFTLLSIRPSAERPDEVEVVFQYVTPEGSVWDVNMTVDPLNSWAVTHYYLEYPWKQQVLAFDCTVTYGMKSPTSSIRLPANARMISGWKEGIASGPHLRQDFTMVNFTVEDVPDSMFTLEAFGLDDSGHRIIPAGRWNSLVLLAINAGILLVLLGLWMTRRSRAKDGHAPSDNRS